jgi:hypothetical protein
MLLLLSTAAAAAAAVVSCRVSWAGLELREGNTTEARELLREAPHQTNP